MQNIKVSLICTLKNEEFSVKDFLESLLSQFIVDGGSTDRTVEIIKSYIKKGAPIKLIVKNGANIAEGRNLAIKNAKYDTIASTDAGCKIDKNWLKNLMKPFEEDPNVDVVAGWYEADARTEFEECVAELTYLKLERVLKNPDKFLPSSRSVAFKKKCWERVGGYPEWLYTAEDTLFDLNLKKAGCKFVLAPDAVVRWKVQPNLRSLFKQFYLYAKGDGEVGLFLLKYKINFMVLLTTISLLYLSFYSLCFLIFLVILGVLYLYFPLLKNKKLLFAGYLIFIPIIRFSIFIATFIGFTKGLSRKFYPKNYLKLKKT